MFNYELFRKVVAPEYASMNDADIDLFNVEAELEISESFFGDLYPRVWCLVTAHIISMSKRSLAGSNGAGSAEIKKIKVGDLEREFNVSSDAKVATDPYNLTSYGKEYKRLRGKVVKAPRYVC